MQLNLTRDSLNAIKMARIGDPKEASNGSLSVPLFAVINGTTVVLYAEIDKAQFRDAKLA